MKSTRSSRAFKPAAVLLGKGKSKSLAAVRRTAKSGGTGAARAETSAKSKGKGTAR